MKRLDVKHFILLSSEGKLQKLKDDEFILPSLNHKNIYNLIFYYSARNSHVEFSEYVLTKYGEYITTFNEKFMFRHKDSCKKIKIFIDSIDNTYPFLYNKKDYFINNYLILAYTRGYVKNFGDMISKIYNSVTKEETLAIYIERSIKQNTDMKKEFYNELMIVRRKGIIDSLLN